MPDGRNGSRPKRLIGLGVGRAKILVIPRFGCVALLLVCSCQDRSSQPASTLLVNPAVLRSAQGHVTSVPSAGPLDADAILAENDRIIAENKRMARTLSEYRQTDPDKPDRRKAGCEKKMGAVTDRESTKRFFQCIEHDWY